MRRYPEPAGDSRLTAPRVVNGGGYSQTLSRGLYLLELMAASATPPTLTELAEGSGFGTTVTHRLLRTLAAHRLVTQRPGGGYTLGFGLVTLTRRVALGLADHTRPVLHRTAEDLGTTVFLGVADGFSPLGRARATSRRRSRSPAVAGTRTAPTSCLPG
ncbi:MAG: helix-turn-helix domain-containing protein [Pseudonocardia sp.]|nr:helix-turn-helix domain-containing protein [Pseudonocardia sp.]